MQRFRMHSAATVHRWLPHKYFSCRTLRISDTTIPLSETAGRADAKEQGVGTRVFLSLSLSLASTRDETSTRE